MGVQLIHSKTAGLSERQMTEKGTPQHGEEKAPKNQGGAHGEGENTKILQEQLY